MKNTNAEREEYWDSKLQILEQLYWNDNEGHWDS